MNSPVFNLMIELVHYGHDKFDLEQFQPVNFRDYWISKPSGGFWGSPVNSKDSWKGWCQANDFDKCDFSKCIRFTFIGRVLRINTMADLLRCPWRDKGPDWRGLKLCGIQGIFLTEAGQIATRFGERNLYGWDCESFFVLDCASIRCQE